MEIINYESRYQPDFKRLNIRWLEQYGLLEPHDLEILDHPESFVISKGGCIFLVRDGDRIVATAGLWKENEEEYEIIKMAVDPEYQGRGLSKLLMEKCLEEARKLQAKKVYLFSNSQLLVALKLYEQYGFRHVAVTNAPFLLSDVKMELSLSPNQ